MSERDTVTRELRKKPSEELSDPYNITKFYLEVKSRRMNWAGHVARKGIGWMYKGFGGEF